MIFDKPIKIQKMDESTEAWSDLYTLHARVNKTQGTEATTSGATRSQVSRTFEVRYFKELEDIAMSTQIYRIEYRGHLYNVVDYDDYMESHQTVKLIAEVS